MLYFDNDENIICPKNTVKIIIKDQKVIRQICHLKDDKVYKIDWDKGDTVAETKRIIKK